MPAQLLIRLATLIVLTSAFLICGCKVLKTTKADKSNTDSVKKIATVYENISRSGTKTSEQSQSHEENEWSKLTMQWLAKNQTKDTIVNNFLNPPSTVIYETGKSNRNQERMSIDSSWYFSTIKMVALAIDSFSRKVDKLEKTKHSKTIGPGLFTLLLIGSGIVFIIYFSKKPH